ncbi:hypothetical protein HUT19_22785 [Streptomyces sp. NA02950]|uniref:hypothetical protein n=1 Tax=Streptomyces sp. NA02950 TaxID=2742137 RepID=UPI001591A3DB|nr:hypothetical protein [Streptomyces sp. NA02950]QKV94236.1 hypothetical protein HUT19_22785 [Streptomyces sp. NA02950]
MRNRQGDRDFLGWIAMAACIAISAHGEWFLAQRCGYADLVAAGLPVAIDAYALRAMDVGREVFPPVLLMVATNAAAHLMQGGMLAVSPWLVVAVSAIAPVVLWRVHALRAGRGPSEVSSSGPLPEPVAEPIYVPPVPAEPVPEPIKARPVPAAVETTPSVPVLGPFVALAELERNHGGTSTGTDADQPKQHPEAEPDETPEPAGGTGGTERGSDRSDEPAEDTDAGRFARHVQTARGWLATEPELTGTAIGKRLDASDSYGRRVRRAALAPT